MPKINISIDEEQFLPCYRHLIESKANINFLWGGRDSGKSYFCGEKLLIDCMSLKYFRCVLIKKTAESIKDSQWQLLKDITEDWGISHLFTFKVSPLEIICNSNGNKFIARGCDDAQKLKSISNPSHAWYEEGNQLEEADYIIASTTLRSNKGDVQEWFSFNPECDGDFKDFWLYKMFFVNHIDKGEYNFTDRIAFTMPDETIYYQTVSSTHTTYRDNLEYCKPARIAKHESYKVTNPYYYQVFTMGQWGKRISGGEVIKCFKAEKHIHKLKYNPKLPLHISFDENVNPYLPCGIFQTDGRNIWFIDEITGVHPNNKITWVCNEIKRKYYDHSQKMYIYGDPASLKNDVKLQRGENLFVLIENELSVFSPEVRVFNVHPSVKHSLDFFNNILELNISGLDFKVSDNCKIAIRDYENAKEDINGNIEKKKVKDEAMGTTYQPFGHFIDLTRYFLCYAFDTEYLKYTNGNKRQTYYVGDDDLGGSNKY